MLILTLIAATTGITALAVLMSLATIYHIGKCNEANRTKNGGGYWYYIKAVTWFWVASAVFYGVFGGAA
ncbi:putative membrane protein [Asticcacaulis biprosthecium C19]|uniref:Putative membrane protein n=1 Tax=Asticcacaulis biprosthecium C19 TaxID=715226 RepID=F4QJ10_9CAUL|nr:hypothetical protein [Asticcacaulis biprosthecium]EGF93073.1 putative membrane protein [Asticcacaulis biprosthecium C19]